MNSKNQAQGNLTIESIKRYENVIESLNKKIQYLEIAAQKSNLDGKDEHKLDWLVYHKYNKNLKERLTFINRVMDWNQFAEELTQQNDKQFKQRNFNSYGSELLQDEAMSKEHFAVSKSSLIDIMEQVYFPVIDI